MSLDFAIKEALRNPIQPIGRNSISRFAAVLSDGYSTFVGFNSYKSHPLQFRFSGSHERVCVHAEIAALAKASRKRVDLRVFKMSIARVLRDGTPALAKPCPSCMAAIVAFSVGSIEYTT